MATAFVEHEFDLPAATLWDLVGDFGNMSKWTGLPRESCLADGDELGATRTLLPPMGGVIIDRLDAKSQWSYSYSIINMDEAPLPFKSYKATLSVEPVSDTKTRLHWGGEFEPDGLSDDETVAFAQSMYERGLEMMKKAAARL